jgi:hypothetical protein
VSAADVFGFLAQQPRRDGRVVRDVPVLAPRCDRRAGKEGDGDRDAGAGDPLAQEQLDQAGERQRSGEGRVEPARADPPSACWSP